MFSPEVPNRSVRSVRSQEHKHSSRLQAIASFTLKIGCTPQALHEWIRRAEVNCGKRAGIPTDTAAKRQPGFMIDQIGLRSPPT
jgi:transposase